MKTTRILTILVLALGLMVCQAKVSEAAEMGSAFTYQGYLYDANHVADGLYDLQFKLFDSPSDGNKIGNDVNKPDVDVIDGYFTVELDFGSAIFTGDARWLEIGVRPGELEDPNVYTTLSPRQAVTPTPYAVHALEAKSLQTDIMPEIVYDSDWLVMPMRKALQIDLGTSDYDFVFPWLHSWSLNGGEVRSPLLGTVHDLYTPGYVSLSGSTLTSLGWSYLGALKSPGDVLDVLLRAGNVRYLAVKRAADYDTGWQACTVNQTYLYAHNLGVFPHFVMVEVAENSDGTGWRVPTMSSCNYDDSNWRQTTIVGLDSNNVTLRTHTSLAWFHNAVGTVLAPTNGYCRIRLWDWTPDYDSGWVGISTTDSDKWFKHDLGKTPSLVMLYVGENSSGTGWVIPAMWTLLMNYNKGTVLYNVTNHWAMVNAGTAAIARFVDGAGSGQAPTSGYVRFMAWK